MESPNTANIYVFFELQCFFEPHRYLRYLFVVPNYAKPDIVTSNLPTKNLTRDGKVPSVRTDHSVRFVCLLLRMLYGVLILKGKVK